MFCSKCGAQLLEGSAFCSQCGTQVAPIVDQVRLAEDISPKSRLAATLLAIFLGWTGAHRFYMGKIKTAVAMLLLGIAPIVCFILSVASVAIYSDQEDPPALFIVSLVLMYVFAIAVGVWSLVDFIIAVTGSFKDRQGRPIRKW